MESACPSQASVLAELAQVAPDAPFLALGQTVFWDEPMKAGLALISQGLGYKRRFLAGVHDTDYFAKLPSRSGEGRYQAVAHNDTTTKGLWSAAGEFSTLFGSETVVSRETLQHAGLKLAKLERARPGILDQATEAWGWRGVVSLSQTTQVTSETALGPLFPELNRTIQWALDSAVDMVAGEKLTSSRWKADAFRTLTCDLSEPLETSTLGEYYRRLIPELYSFAAGTTVDVDATSTTELLQFNQATCGLPRFQIVGFFADPKTRALAQEAYNQSVARTEVYTLHRFGTGAIPFDLIVPGHGRGTIRLGNRAIIVMTPKPLFISLKKPLTGLEDLAAAIEKKFGPNCTLTGKAVSLIGMLACEHVFVFHEGGSGYVNRTREFHKKLSTAGLMLDLKPVLRIRYEPWDALGKCCTWFAMPEPFQQAFGTSELCAASFSARWRDVVKEQEALLEKLGQLARPIDLIEYLAQAKGGGWEQVAHNYRKVHEELDRLNSRIADLKIEKKVVLAKLRDARRARSDAEIAKGIHWRAKIFEKNASDADFAERARLTQEVHNTIEKVQQVKHEWDALEARQEALVRDEPVLRAHDRRRDLELEAELKRLELIRNAVIVSQGLPKAGHRPGAWWFPLVCPDGTWFQETVRRAEYSLEFLQ